MGDFVAWTLFLVLGPILWASGLWLYLRAEMSAQKKWIWALLLAVLGSAIGLLLPLRAIRDRFLIVAAVLPILAFIDTKLATSRRGMLFWFRACAFEVCTVFGVAGIVAGLRW